MAADDHHNVLHERVADPDQPHRPVMPMAFFTRREAAEFLTERGLPISDRTLADLAVDGRGPPTGRWGRLVIYDEDDLLAWARGRLWRPQDPRSQQ